MYCQVELFQRQTWIDDRNKSGVQEFNRPFLLLTRSQLSKPSCRPSNYSHNAFILHLHLVEPTGSRTNPKRACLPGVTGQRQRVYRGFSTASVEELKPAHVPYCPPWTIMWSVPVGACCADAANVYCAGVSCGFGAAGHSLSLELRVDTDTTRPIGDRRTSRQSCKEANVKPILSPWMCLQLCGKKKLKLGGLSLMAPVSLQLVRENFLKRKNTISLSH